MSTPLEIEEAIELNFYACLAEHAEAQIYDTDEVWLFTWSPDPAKYPTFKCRDQYKILLDLVLMKSDKCFKTFCFTPELTKNGNVHIHGWYVIKDKVKYFKWFMPKCKAFGNIKIDLMKSNKALYYYKKDIDLMNQVLGDDLPIPLTHENIDAYKPDPQCKKRMKLRRTPYKFNVMNLQKFFNGK